MLGSRHAYHDRIATLSERNGRLAMAATIISIAFAARSPPRSRRPSASASCRSSPTPSRSHGIAMIGEPALPADFDHLPYVNPDAPKGGKITYGVVGTFDSINPFIVQGGLDLGARPLLRAALRQLVFESLLERSADEPFTLYGFIAETRGDAARPGLGRVHAQPEGEILRRPAGDGRRRDLQPRAPARQGTAELPAPITPRSSGSSGSASAASASTSRTPTTASCR